MRTMYETEATANQGTWNFCIMSTCLPTLGLLGVELMIVTSNRNDYITHMARDISHHLLKTRDQKLFTCLNPASPFT